VPTLRELLRNLPHIRVSGDLETSVGCIAYDSRLVKPGDLFVALPGYHTDGAVFIPDALQRGAAAVATQASDVTVPEGIAHLLVKDIRQALTGLAASFHGYPGRQIRVVGVTGTDGKTTTTYLVSAALEAMGFRTGFITTADVKVGDQVWRNDTQHTTPEPVEIQGLLRQMVDEGIDYAVVESSSHALALDRLLHCEFDAAVFTNLSPEHLNFHGSMEGYLRDKMKLFSLLDQAMDKGVDKVAVLNADDPRSHEIAAATRSRVIWYGLGGDGVKAANVQLLPGGSRFTLLTPLGAVDVETRLTGRFNVYNWLAAASVALGHGASLDQIQRAMLVVDSVPGRMQRIDEGQPFSVVVDFAHTPQALETALRTLRPITWGRLFVLFGMAGERDPSNRSEQGRVAARMADLALFTVDDPRFEDPMEIAEQVAEGARSLGWREGVDYLKVPDREEAIREAFRRAGPGDTVLLAGKGHETRQVIGDQLLPWNDGEAARRILREMQG